MFLVPGVLDVLLVPIAVVLCVINLVLEEMLSHWEACSLASQRHSLEPWAWVRMWVTQGGHPAAFFLGALPLPSWHHWNSACHSWDSRVPLSHLTLFWFSRSWESQTSHRHWDSTFGCEVCPARAPGPGTLSSALCPRPALEHWLWAGLDRPRATAEQGGLLISQTHPHRSLASILWTVFPYRELFSSSPQHPLHQKENEMLHECIFLRYF